MEENYWPLCHQQDNILEDTIPEYAAQFYEEVISTILREEKKASGLGPPSQSHPIIHLCIPNLKENEDLMLGEEDLLISGPVCVTTSFLTITGALLVPKSFMLSIRASAQAENNISKG
ncbi:unnamed protein product [Miscanthus lutarioriparius]|uniref:Uncharacterized protein n=1 Tax=Miscanthus lutarioriparius TaxID=422564 RepID=A0A811PDH2_9POAL|nr:unnamed protein product [Miscanthus lutarioriparius]